MTSGYVFHYRLLCGSAWATLIDLDFDATEFHQTGIPVAALREYDSSI